MDVDEKRQSNIEKAEEDQARGPARKEPAATPMGEAIEAFHKRGDLSFGIPAHRSGDTDVTLDLSRWAAAAVTADVGMTNGLDTRDQSWGVETTAMELFAEAVGADTTLFSTNGSTENVHVAIMSAVRPGETLVMARNGHKSAFAGLVLSGAMPVYVDPVYDPEWQVAHGVEPSELQRVLDAHPEARAVMVFSPTYYGASADLRGLAEAAHAHDLPLVTDDAWGLSYSFCSRMPPSAMESGADMAIGSVHKKLSGLSPTSVLSIKGDRIDADWVSLVFELEQSTSSSALLVSSIDAARRQFQRDGERLIGRSIDLAKELRRELSKLPELRVMELQPGQPGVAAVDPTHVSIDVVGLGLTGFSAADWLQQHRGVFVELADHRRIMVLISFADTEEHVERLLGALRDLVEDHAGADSGGIPEVGDPGELRLETVMRPRDAFFGHAEVVPWREAAGRVSAEMICPYPPGIPITAPGELITREVVDYLEAVVAAGAMVEGALDSTLATFRVVAG